MEQVGIGEYVKTGLTRFGKEVNTNRQLTLELDGLKPVYRRLIYTALNYPDKMVKTATLAGKCMGELHPHGDTSLVNVISTLVRYGIFEGQGNHGAKLLDGEDLSPSAPRYTEAKISPKWRKIFSEFMAYVPYKDGELDGFKEPCFLPTPIPLALSFGNLGIGFGVNMRLPAFTVQSMYEAFIKDDPTLLESPFGLILDKKESELKQLWETGIGRLTYRYKVYQEWIESGNGTMIEGDAELFKPNLIQFDPWIESGRVYKIDLTSDIGRIFIGKTANVRAINLDQIYEMCVEASTYRKTFRTTVSDGEQAYLIPLKTWIGNCVANYYSIIEKYKVDQLKKSEFEYKVYYHLKEVAECQINNRNWEAEDISSYLNIDLEIVRSILRKSISTLRNTDSTAKLAGIQEQIEYYKNLDIAKKINQLINEF